MSQYKQKKRLCIEKTENFFFLKCCRNTRLFRLTAEVNLKQSITFYFAYIKHIARYTDYESCREDCFEWKTFPFNTTRLLKIILSMLIFQKLTCCNCISAQYSFILLRKIMMNVFIYKGTVSYKLAAISKNVYSCRLICQEIYIPKNKTF